MLDETFAQDMSARFYNMRSCPGCNGTIFGMPGGRDAHCHNCGYKDPCCSD